MKHLESALVRAVIERNQRQLDQLEDALGIPRPILHVHDGGRPDNAPPAARPRRPNLWLVPGGRGR